MTPRRVGAAVLVSFVLALTGCSRGVAPVPAHTSPPAVSQVASPAPPSVAASAADIGALDGISKDLDAADSANAATDADQHSADQATATSDD